MQFKLSKETAVAWIESTVDEIKKMLELRKIPYKDSFIKNENHLMAGVFYIHQLKFPWHEGDVVVGTLHASDDYIINGLSPLGYPSIETYAFPWDEDDITVFETPEQFMSELSDLYATIVAAKTNA